MRAVPIAIALCISSMSLVSYAHAQSPTKYGEEAGWEILVRPDMGPGCLITKSNPGGLTQVQMGIDATADLKGYMAIYTKKDANIAQGEEVSVVFDVDGQQYTGEAKGQELDGFAGAFVWVNNPELIYELAKKKKLTITSPGRPELVVNLAGTDAAFNKLRECQAAQ